MAQTHGTKISPGPVIRSILAQCYSLLHDFHIQRNNTSLKINCPQQPTYTVLGKYGFNILPHRENKEQGRGEFIMVNLHFSFFTPNVCRVPSSVTLSLGAAELLLPTMASKKAPPILISRVTQYQETLNGFKRLKVMETENGLKGRY